MEKIQAKYQITEAKLHISKGNSKIGKIANFSTLPGNSEHMLKLKDGTLLTDVPGTCSHHCDTCFNGGCYAKNSAIQYHNTVIKNWGENTNLLRSGRLEAELNNYFNQHPDVKILRFNVSGEITCVGDLEMLNNLAKNHPDVKIAIYTKNYEDLDKFMQKYGKFEKNFIINVSQWHGCANAFLAKYPNTFNVFEYDDSNLKNNTLSAANKDRLSQLTHCPGISAAGKHTDITCDKCGRCYRNTQTTTAVYAH